MHNLWERHAVPYLVRLACGASSIERQRVKVIPPIAGRVLEIGIGSGLNLPHYAPERVTEVVGVDPSPALLRDAAAVAAKLSLPVRLELGSAERLPVEDASVDAVVVTYALCSVPDLDRALAEVRRVLRPEGALHFCEHGLAPDANVRRWQARIEPVWMRIGGGCHLTRPIPALLEAAGYSIVALDTMYLPGLRILNWNTWGVARP